MLLVVALCSPLLLLALMLAMDRVERPLRDEALGEQVVAVLETAHPDEVEIIVSTDAALAINRHWRRFRRRGRPLVRRAGRPA
ncbi:MAG TPA: hypothetical protein VNG13_09375 [Mycobacteriales bacterium]|nr:hypothetical protein [Mycobacteriales bacterium]